MELPNANYLYTLALISVTYVGFTAIVLILRQSLGSAVLPIDALVARLFMGWGFLLTFTSMLPMALAAYEFQPASVWRAASAISGLSFVAMQIGYPIARRRVTRKPTPLHVWLHVASGLTLGFVLLLNSAHLFPRALAAIYAWMVTLYVIQASFAFVQQFGFMLAKMGTERA